MTDRAYVSFDSGLDMNSRYLTEKVAYFLMHTYNYQFPNTSQKAVVGLV